MTTKKNLFQLIKRFTNETSGGNNRQYFEQVRKFVRQMNPVLIRSLVGLYVKDFKSGQSALQRLTPRQREYYQIKAGS